MGNIAREFQNGSFDENAVENVDETHFVYDMNDRYCLSRKGSQSVSCLDMVSGGELITIVLRIAGGANAVLAPPFPIFRNRLAIYPIIGPFDDHPRVSYRSQRNGWMHLVRFVQWLGERLSIAPLPENRHRTPISRQFFWIYYQ